MGYTPAYDARSISVHIGTVGGGTMTSGSPIISDAWFSPLPGHATAQFFSAADVGRLVTVLGAGPAGAILIGRVVSFLGTQSVELDVAASTSVSDGPIVTVFRPCDVLREALSYDSTLTARDTATFTARSLDGSFIPVEGQPVLFVSEDPAVGDEYGVFFGGAIDSVSVQNYLGNPQLDSECQCISWEHLATKRVMMGQKYYGQPAGTIFADIVAKGLVGDFVGASAVAGPSIPALTIDDYTVVADALDRVAQAVSSAVDVYYWKMDPWRRAIFALQTTTPAPWSIDHATGTDANILASLRFTRTREKLSNQAYVEAGQQLNPPQTYTAKIGTGGPIPIPPGYANRSLTLPAVPAVIPSMTLDGSPLVIKASGDDPRLGTATVPAGADWAWLVGTDFIWTDPTHPGLTVGHTIVVTYQTADVGHAFASYGDSVSERSAVEGGTGYHETLVTVDQPISREELTALAESVAQRFGQIPTVVDVETYRSGLKVGQSLTINRPEVSGEFVISSANMSVQDGVPKWSITATNGSVIGDWRTALMGAFGGGSGVAGGGGAGVTLGSSRSGVTGGSRTVTANGAQASTDELVLFDTSGIATSTDTLGAAVTDTTGTSWTFGSGAAIVNGTYVQVGTEKVYIVSGSGATRTVERGALGTTAATHPNGATVTVPGALAFSLLAIADWPNGSLILRKSSSDINYVSVQTATGDSFPGGGTTLLLPDNSADRGTVSLRSPAPPDTVWILLAAAGATGPAGPPGAAGVGTPAPNVLSATCSVSYVTADHNQDAVFTIPATLDTGNADYSHDKSFEAYGVDPSGNEHLIARVSAWSGGTITLTGAVGRQPAPGVSQTWKARIVAYNEQGAPTDPPYEITGISVTGPSITGLVGTDDTGDRWTDANRSVYAPQSVAYTGQAMTFTLWLYDGTRNAMQGWYTVSGATTFKIGLKGQKEIIFAPPSSSTWTLKAAPGAWEGSDADGWRCPDYGLGPRAIASVPGIYSSSAYSVAGMAKPGASEITSLAIPAGAGGSWPYNKIDADSGAQYWGWDSMTYDDSSAGINAAFVTLTCQDYDASNNPIGPEHRYGVRPIGGGAGQNWGALNGPYGSAAVPARSGAIAKVGLRMYISSRKNGGDDAWQDSTTSTLQTSIGSSGLLLVTVAAGGSIPAGKIPTTRLDATTFGPNLRVNDLGLLDIAKSEGSNLLDNPGFESGTQGWTLYDNGMGMHFQSDATINHTAAGSRCLEINALVNGATCGASQTKAIIGGRTYSLHVWHVADGGAAFDVQIVIWYYTATGAFLTLSVVGGGLEPLGAGWQRLGGVFQAPTNAAMAVFGIQVACTGGSGNLHFDDAEAYLLPDVGDGNELDASGRVKAKIGDGLEFDATTRAHKLKTGGNVGVDGSGNPIVKNGTLGEAVFVGGALGTDLSKWSSTKIPFGYYFGLPSPFDSNVPAVIINTAETPWRVYNKVSGAWVAQKTQPGDLVAGAITALVSMTSPTISGGSISGGSISGGSISGSSYTLTSGTQTLTMSVSGAGGILGIQLFDSTSGRTITINKDYVRLYTTSGNQTTTLGHGTITISKRDGTGDPAIFLDATQGTLSLYGTFPGVFVNGVQRI